MTPVRGIIFDKDGTLFDFASTWEAWAAAFLLRIADDSAQAAVLGQAIGFDFQERQFKPDSVVIAGTPDQVAKALQVHVPRYSPIELLAVLNEEAALAPQMEAVPLGPFLKGFHDQGILLGVVTNDAEKPARAHLGAAGVTSHFDFIAGSDSGHGAKPAPGQLLAFATEFNLSPAEILMIGDSTHDLMAANAAGMRGIGVLTGIAAEEELSPYAEVVLPDIGHIPAWLRYGSALLDR